MARVIAVVAVLLTVLGILATGNMRSPAPPRWYVERLRLAPNAQLHPGLLVREDLVGFGSIKLAPAEADPIYLLKPGSAQADLPMPPVPLPPGYVVELKMEQQRIYYWQPQQPQGQRWVDAGAGLPFQIGLYNFFYADAFEHGARPAGTDRPLDAVPPPPQQRSIHVIVGQERAQVPVELRYELNPDYDREVESYHKALGKHRWGRVLAVGMIVVAGLAALLVIAGLAATLALFAWVMALTIWQVTSWLFRLLGWLLALPLLAFQQHHPETPNQDPSA